jgi:CRP/FNR family transcriptional regulator, cyclic AMP receptor protein
MGIQRKSKEIIIDSLLYLPLFDSTKGAELKVVADHMNFFQVEKNEILFREGDKGDHVCFILEGTIDIIKESSPGHTVVIASLPKGRSIGEMSIVDNFPRSATARAQTKASILKLTQLDFNQMLKKHPEIGIKILTGILRLLSLNLRKTSSRLADYMLPVT